MSGIRPSLYPEAEQYNGDSNNNYTQQNHQTEQPSIHHSHTSPLNNVSHASYASAPPPEALDNLLRVNSTVFNHQFDTLPSDYEVLLEVEATITEQSIEQNSSIILKAPKSGILRVIQGPIPSTTSQTLSYHAFISIENVNIPLLSTYTASKIASNSFYINIPEHTFLIEIINNCPSELIEGFEKLLKWFCQWENLIDNTQNKPQGINISNEINSKSIQRITQAGDKGVEIVGKVGQLINNKINKSLDNKKMKIQNEQEQGINNGKEIKLGGKFTNSLLSTTRQVIGVGAAATSKVTAKVSTHVSNVMVSNSMTRNLSEAPEESKKKQFYDHLMAGALVFGRIYVEVDRQSNLIIRDTGDRMSEIANKKYGYEAEMVARNISGIALDGYRISRFPQKLGATSIVKGAFKTKFAKDSTYRSVYDEQYHDDEDFGESVAKEGVGVARHPQTYHSINHSQFNDISEEDAR